eukprot:5131357-Karenia_brevis.AAC.1
MIWPKPPPRQVDSRRSNFSITRHLVLVMLLCEPRHDREVPVFQQKIQDRSTLVRLDLQSPCRPKV